MKMKGFGLRGGGASGVDALEAYWGKVHKVHAKDLVDTYLPI